MKKKSAKFGKEFCGILLAWEHLCQPSLAVALKITGLIPDLGSHYWREQYRPVSKNSGGVFFYLSGGSLKNHLKGLAYISPKNSPRSEATI